MLCGQPVCYALIQDGGKNRESAYSTLRKKTIQNNSLSSQEANISTLYELCAVQGEVVTLLVLSPLLVLHTLSHHYTPSPGTAYPLLVLQNLSSYCGCDSPGTAGVQIRPGERRSLPGQVVEVRIRRAISHFRHWQILEI